MTAAAGDPPVRCSPRPGFGLSAIRAALAPTLLLEEGPRMGLEAAVALILREPAPSNAPPRVSLAGGARGRPLQTAPHTGAELLLIRRAERSEDPWSGHMALPGGRRDPVDESLLHTARRETFEEVGLRLEKMGHLIGRLPTLPAMAQGRPVGMTVLPLVFHLTEAAELIANDEVAEALWVPLEHLHSGRLDTSIEYSMRGASEAATRLPAWAIEGRIVWGLTHRMITTLLDLLSRQTV